MKLKLAVNALIKYLCGIIPVGLLLFKAPDLLKRRLDSKEKQGIVKK